MSDELFERLQRQDPASSVPIEPADSPRAIELMEQIMTTPLVNETETTSPPPKPRTRRPLFAALAAVGILAVGGAITATVLAGGDGSEQQSSVSYPLAASDPLTTICLAITDAPPPPDTAVAFGGTVSSIDGDRVTLDVDRWYQNGNADQVVLVAGPDLPSVALDGVEFVVGTRYLVTVVDGTVAICGYSGPATPELEALYQTWYG